jgi:hypothetical protein
VLPAIDNRQVLRSRGSTCVNVELGAMVWTGGGRRLQVSAGDGLAEPLAATLHRSGQFVASTAERITLTTSPGRVIGVR